MLGEKDGQQTNRWTETETDRSDSDCLCVHTNFTEHPLIPIITTLILL